MNEDWFDVIKLRMKRKQLASKVSYHKSICEQAIQLAKKIKREEKKMIENLDGDSLW